MVPSPGGSSLADKVKARPKEEPGELNRLDRFQMFDSHFHIIDSRFPLVPNNGFLPHEFTCEDYLHRTSAYALCGGAVVSASFQAFDQTWLLDALEKLGPSFVGVTQLPLSVPDNEIIELNKSGVRAVRFNLKRGGSEQISDLASMAERVYEVAGWHTELYVDASDLQDLFDTLVKLPSVSIDHLGLSRSGLKILEKLVDKGVKVKATGFGRADFDVRAALRNLYSVNPGSLMFGTDLPSTRTIRPYTDDDFMLVVDALGSDGATAVFSSNAIEFYRLPDLGARASTE